MLESKEPLPSMLFGSMLLASSPVFASQSATLIPVSTLDEVQGEASDHVNPLGKALPHHSSPTSVWAPSPGTSWQWQLSGVIEISYAVEMYAIDQFDASQATIDELHARNVAVVCYFSAGSFEDWRSDAGAFPDAVKGESSGWAGERWLDIRALDLAG